MNLKKVLIRIMVLCALICMLNITVEAASFSASASKTTVTTGDTFTITATASGAAGTYQISTSGTGVSVVSGSTSGFLDNSSATVTYKANSPGTVTITATATDMTDNNDDTKTVKGSKTFSIAVNNKKENTNTNTNKPVNNTTTKPNNNTTTNKTNNKTNNSTNNTTNNQQKDLTFSSTSGTVYASQSMNLRADYKTTAGAKTIPAGAKLTILAKSNGTHGGYTWYKVSYNGTTGYVATGLVTTTKPAEIPTLTALTINPGTYTPTFSKGTTVYNVSVESNVEQVKINATAETGATATITCNGASCSNGTVPINEGLNTVKIAVSKDGQSNTYSIYIRKSVSENETGNISDNEDKNNNNEELFLKSIEIAGLALSPEFDKETYSYTVVIPEDDNRTSLDITALATIENANIEIVDNKDLKYGENIVTIMVKSEDGKTTKIYQIVVNKLGTEAVAAEKQAAGSSNVVAQNKGPVALICGLVILAVVCLVFLIKSGKKIDEFEKQLDEEVNRDDILNTEISEEAYETNQYLKDLRDKENDNNEKSENIENSTVKIKKGKHF